MPTRAEQRRISRSLSRLCRTEVLLFVREPAAMFFTMAFPLLLLLFVGAVYGNEVNDGVKYIDEFVPTVVAIIAANLGVMGVSLNLADLRARGVLRRYKLVPLPLWCFFAAQIAVGVVMFVVSLSALFAVTALGYGLRVHGSLAACAAVSGLTLATTITIGFLLGSVRASVRTVQLAGTAIFFVLFFGSGAAIPRSQFPGWLRAVTAFNPLTPLVEALVDAFLGRPLGPHLPTLAALTAFVVIGALAARRLFCWEAPV